MAETVRTETYPSQDNRVPENARHANRALEQADSDITREFAARTAAVWANQKRVPAQNGVAAENQEDLIRRIAGVSLTEIDQTIRDLEAVRGVLVSEGERVGREISGYLGLSQSAASAMKDVAAKINEWKTRSDALDRRPAR